MLRSSSQPPHERDLVDGYVVHRVPALLDFSGAPVLTEEPLERLVAPPCIGLGPRRVAFAADEQEHALAVRHGAYGAGRLASVDEHALGGVAGVDRRNERVRAG